MKATTKDRGTRVINLGGVLIGGDNPVVVQSMTNTETLDAASTVRQIKKLAKAGCEIVRVAVPDKESAAALAEIVSSSPVPVVADIHFQADLAMRSLDAGVHGLRLNPGNIRRRDAVERVVRAAKDADAPLRVGVNAGSVPRDLLRKYSGPTPQALVESAMEHVAILEDMGFTDVKVSLKASDVLTTVEAYRLMRRTRDYPLHLGVTEAGALFTGLVKSAAGMGILLSEGIGDTVRVSLAADPVEEVRAGFAILKAMGLSTRGVEVIACPTCARTMLDVQKTASAMERRLRDIASPLRIAIMGCGVNGPGEARHSDLGCVGTTKGVQVYVKGERAGTVEEKELVSWMVKTARELARQEHTS